MRGRRYVWSDLEVRALASRFAAAADEVWRLQNRDEPDCRLFKSIAEHGHYGGRNGTRQGTYAFTAAGEFLGSTNTNDPKRMAQMLKEALAKWDRLPRDRRVPSPRLSGTPDRAEEKYPEDGLVLEVISRDVDRPPGPQDDWRAQAWNKDWAWFTAEEARGWVPSTPARGATQRVPDEQVRRLARLNFVDNVRGQTITYEVGEVSKAEITAKVESVKRGVAEIRYEGEARSEARGGQWARAIKLKILGRAKYDTAERRLVEFELVAVGTRRGRTQYNFRDGDEAEAPIGICARLSPYDPPVRTAPAFFWEYKW